MKTIDDDNARLPTSSSRAGDVPDRPTRAHDTVSFLELTGNTVKVMRMARRPGGVSVVDATGRHVFQLVIPSESLDDRCPHCGRSSTIDDKFDHGGES